ncbi:MAG TPA: hypothetical protein VGN72_24195 [Tepidisphaeraceae bacterium]|jgi:hypothetical protein|nr:hypothetical protein [Tepidisphaeraceae bacterium]
MPDPQRALVEKYLNEMEQNRIAHYEGSAKRYRFASHASEIAALLATSTTSVLAGIYSVEGQPGFWLVALSILAT